MENKVSDNVIEKNYRECLKFNEINESGACNFDLATAKAALENLYELYKNGILTGRFTKDKDYVVRCADLVILAEENKDSLFYEAWRIWFVVPKPYISCYPRDRQDRIWTISRFVRYIKSIQNTD